jgi:hypothetical protein
MIPRELNKRRSHPVSVVLGVSWLPAIITMIVSGRDSTRRANWVYACRMAGFVGRTA